MMKIFSVAVAAILFSASCCTTKQQNANSTISAATNDSIYPLYLNFVSIGTGVPDAEPLETFFKSFKAANNLNFIMAEKFGPLGKEGEYALGFRLLEMNNAQRKDFVDGVKKVVEKIGNSRGSVQVHEYHNRSTDGWNRDAPSETLEY